MLRRFAVAYRRPALPQRAFRSFERRCATATEKEAAAQQQPPSAVAARKVEGAAGGKASGEAPPLPHGPQRKDWRTHKDVVYVKGIPVKGSMFKLSAADQFIIYLVFSLAGAGAVYLVRPQIRYLCHHGFLGLTEDAGWKNGPWLYRLLYVFIMFPSYSAILFVVGSVFGRRIWFSFMIHKMWSRFLTKNASKRLAYLLDIQHY